MPLAILTHDTVKSLQEFHSEYGELQGIRIDTELGHCMSIPPDHPLLDHLQVGAKFSQMMFRLKVLALAIDGNIFYNRTSLSNDHLWPLFAMHKTGDFVHFEEKDLQLVI